jgi:hypothetical protein
MASRKLKVYSWQGWRNEIRYSQRCGCATTEVLAAPSIAAVIRITGNRRSDLFNINETGNESAISIAMSEPGVHFWRCIDDQDGEWKRA